mmetsp:Transcript_10405/g.19581  ORF Transcript_10405/g.19581 Transcript_10405/m.19581 type:complete len:236 (-) Transcript_10405:121-828(-)
MRASLPHTSSSTSRNATHLARRFRDRQTTGSAAPSTAPRSPVYETASATASSNTPSGRRASHSARRCSGHRVMQLMKALRTASTTKPARNATVREPFGMTSALNICTSAGTCRYAPPSEVSSSFARYPSTVVSRMTQPATFCRRMGYSARAKRIRKPSTSTASNSSCHAAVRRQLSMIFAMNASVRPDMPCVGNAHICAALSSRRRCAHTHAWAVAVAMKCMAARDTGGSPSVTQ